MLSYTALTDESQRQRLLAHLLAWLPVVASEPMAPTSNTDVDHKSSAIAERTLITIALLLAAGGGQTEDQLRARAHAHLGADLSADDVSRALEELSREGLIGLDSARLNSGGPDVLNGFLEQRGLHPYVRELEDLLATGRRTHEEHRAIPRSRCRDEPSSSRYRREGREQDEVHRLQGPLFVEGGIIRSIESRRFDRVYAVGVSSKSRSMPALGGILYGAAALRHDIVVSGTQVTEGYQDSRVDINDMNFLDASERLAWKEYILVYRLLTD